MTLVAHGFKGAAGQALRDRLAAESMPGKAVSPTPAEALLAWYDAHRRALPWRAPPGARADPYRVWLSEIMLQQTTVAAVIAYYERFTARWPDVAALAAAPEAEILAAWAGLGYYSRARNLIAAARRLAAEGLPGDEAGWRALPGVGPYTAAAIAAIAHDQPAVVVDGNVERVVARLAAIETPLPAGRKEIVAAAALVSPVRRPGDYAQAMMDLGAIVCTPRAPACGACPLAGFCKARAQGRAADLPRRAPRAVRPERRGAVFVARRADGAVLVRSRPPRGLLGGMTEFPGTDWTATPAGTDAAPLKLDWRGRGNIRHVFTHFALTLDVYVAAAPQSAATPAGCRWVGENALAAEALPSLMRKAATQAGLGLR